MERLVWFRTKAEYYGFQSFFSGKLFGKALSRALAVALIWVSILLLWKVIWKDNFCPLRSDVYGFVSILLLWKVIWKAEREAKKAAKPTGFNPSSLESYLESCCWRRLTKNSMAFQSFFSGKLFGKTTKELKINVIRWFQSFFSGKLFGKKRTHQQVKGGFHVSILLLWKVIWKGLSVRLFLLAIVSFNPSSLESYLESLDLQLHIKND